MYVLGHGEQGEWGMGRPFWFPTKMVEEGVAFQSFLTLLLPGTQGTWRYGCFSPTVRIQTLGQMHS